jgi:hypothetical protein
MVYGIRVRGFESKRVGYWLSVAGSCQEILKGRDSKFNFYLKEYSFPHKPLSTKNKPATSN